MPYHDPIRDGKSQAKTGGPAARAGLLRTIKSLKDVRQVFGGDARPGVPADDACLPSDPLEAEEDIPALWGILNRIGDKVDENLFEPVTISIHIYLIDLVQVHMDFVSSQYTHLLKHLGDQQIQLDGFFHQGQLTRFSLSQQQ